METWKRENKVLFDDWFTKFDFGLKSIKEVMEEAWNTGYDEGWLDYEFFHELPLDGGAIKTR